MRNGTENRGNLPLALVAAGLLAAGAASAAAQGGASAVALSAPVPNRTGLRWRCCASSLPSG